MSALKQLFVGWEKDLILQRWERAGLIYPIDMSKLHENESIYNRFAFGFPFPRQLSANPIAKLLNRGSENE